MNKETLRIVFFGTPDFAVESLRQLVDGGFNICGVVTMPDKPAGRGHKMYQSPVKEYALSHGLKLLQPLNLKAPDFISELKKLNGNLFIVIAFRMLPEVVWKMPELGTFNLHASLLPKYRGAAPINWAIINGDTKTGVTTFFLKHEIDTGDIIEQEEIEILPSDNAGSLHDKLMHIGARLTLKTVCDIISETLSVTPQNAIISTISPTPAPKIFKETCRIEWDKTSGEVHNFIRGLSPYPAAWTDILFSDNTQINIKVFETEVTEIKSIKPGNIYIQDNSLLIDTADKKIRIISLQPQGKKRMTADEYLRGLRINPIKAV